MSWKWGGRMSGKCIYYVEGLCEVVLVFDTDVPQTTNLRKNRKKRYSQLALLYDKLELVGNISPTFE